MSGFDPSKFEDKYLHYFPELQRAYKQAFDRMNETFDSQLVHAIDQQILNESEPFYVEQSSEDLTVEEAGHAGGVIRIELPDDPYNRLRGVIVDQNRFDRVLDAYVAELERALSEEFGLDNGEEPKA